MGEGGCLNLPPDGGTMRHGTAKPKPWKAIGIGRATWYRQGKPTKKRVRLTQADEAANFGISLRTWQRFCRIMDHAPDLVPFIQQYGMPISVAEHMIVDPQHKERFLRRVSALKAEQTGSPSDQ
jgi:hypothetical protein